MGTALKFIPGRCNLRSMTRVKTRMKLGEKFKSIPVATRAMVKY